MHVPACRLRSLLSRHRQHAPRPSGGLCYDKHHVRAVTVAVALPDKLPCVLRGGFIRKNFRINPLQRGFVGKCAFYRHLSRKKVRLNRCWTNRAARGWLALHRTRLLACDNCHVIFTWPHELNPLWLANVPVMPPLLLQAVRDTLATLRAAPKYLCAQPGIIAALHT